MRKAVVIGSGIGGLASALRLKSKGYDVTVFEASSHVGGKMHEIRKGGFRWDSGPSLFTLPQLVDELFELFNYKPSSRFQYSKKDVICNYFWEDGTRFSASADTSDFASDAAKTFKEDQENIQNYIQRSKEKYELTASTFLQKSLHSLSSYISVDALRTVIESAKLDLFGSLDELNRKYFSNEKLVQLFNRYATYNGSSPYSTPGIMSMIPHLEMNGGTYFPKYGMKDIAYSLYDLAREQQIDFYFQEKVEKILHDGKNVLGVRTPKGDCHADVVVSNMDVYPTYKYLLSDIQAPKRTLSQERSSSALIFYWGISKNFPELDLHNIFFSEQYEKEFDYLFRKKEIYNDPTVYINISSKEKKDDAPEGMENWFVMLNAPANSGQDWQKIIEESRGNTIRKLSRILKTDISKLIVEEDVLDPIMIEEKTSSYQGSLYGTASNSKFSAFLRHPNFSSKLKNLYFVGGSVHPGGGIPLCLSSAKIVGDIIPQVKDQTINQVAYA